MRQKTKHVPNRVLILYTILFFAVWTLHEFITKPMLLERLGDLTGALLCSAVKLLVWVLPCIFLLRRYRDCVLIPLKQQFQTKVRWRQVLVIVALFAAYLLLSSFITYGNIMVRDSFDPIDLIGKVLFVGITEELVFRGWLLNALLCKMKPWQAILISSLLFLVIHFPIWIHSGEFVGTMGSGSFLLIILLSVIFSLLFIKFKNLLVPITLHMFWNLLTIILFN